jgi:uncharacterized coiled-coil protein SlyX
VRIFGWVSSKEHEEIIYHLDRAYDARYVTLQDLNVKAKHQHQQEVQNLRGQITHLENKLKIAEGKAVAEAHEKGEPAPKHVPFPRPKAKRPKVVKP